MTNIWDDNKEDGAKHYHPYHHCTTIMFERFIKRDLLHSRFGQVLFLGLPLGLFKNCHIGPIFALRLPWGLNLRLLPDFLEVAFRLSWDFCNSRSSTKYCLTSIMSKLSFLKALQNCFGRQDEKKESSGNPYSNKQSIKG